MPFTNYKSDKVQNQHQQERRWSGTIRARTNINKKKSRAASSVIVVPPAENAKQSNCEPYFKTVDQHNSCLNLKATMNLLKKVTASLSQIKNNKGNLAFFSPSPIKIIDIVLNSLSTLIVSCFIIFIIFIAIKGGEHQPPQCVNVDCGDDAGCIADPDGSSSYICMCENSHPAVKKQEGKPCPPPSHQGKFICIINVCSCMHPISYRCSTVCYTLYDLVHLVFTFPLFKNITKYVFIVSIDGDRIVIRIGRKSRFKCKNQQRLPNSSS